MILYTPGCSTHWTRFFFFHLLVSAQSKVAVPTGIDRWHIAVALMKLLRRRIDDVWPGTQAPVATTQLGVYTDKTRLSIPLRGTGRVYITRDSARVLSLSHVRREWPSRVSASWSQSGSGITGSRRLATYFGN